VVYSLGLQEGEKKRKNLASLTSEEKKDEKKVDFWRSSSRKERQVSRSVQESGMAGREMNPTDSEAASL